MDDLQITGEVKKVLEEQSGESKNGPWRKRDFILETQGKYPKPVCITQWGDNIDQDSVHEGETVTAYIDIQSREYKGRWYTDVKAWKIEKGAGGEGSKDIQLSSSGSDDDFDPQDVPDDIDDELPF